MGGVEQPLKAGDVLYVPPACRTVSRIYKASGPYFASTDEKGGFVLPRWNETRQVTSLGVMNMYITSAASESGIGTRASECSVVLAKSSHQISAYPSHGTSGA